MDASIPAASLPQLDDDDLAAWLAGIALIFGHRERFESLVDLARRGLPETLYPAALQIVETALADAPREQRWALWELAAAATSPTWTVQLLRHALRYSPLADDAL